MKYESQTRKVTILALMTTLLTLVYIFGASPYDGTFGTLQAQGNNGAITGLTLTSDTPGTLTVSWDTTSPVPTDHRVDWAKTGENYQSWKVDEGHKYPAPTATTATIADLEHDTEYKIRLRTRYYRGEYEGKSWGGPWAEATLQVAGTPDTPSNTVTRDADPPEPALPAAPSLINTAVTEGQVLLSWFKPSDDSITGYQILRGPEADNLVVIEDDTGSSSTSYTDTAPPAGQTHTYGVKARNSAGLSPAGTATATVPAAEEKEELVTARHESAGDTLVSNLEQPDGSSLVEAGLYGGSQKKVAVSFTTGGNVFGYHPTGVQLDLFEYNRPTTDVSVREDNAGNPSDIVLSSFTKSTVIADEDSATELTTFTTSGETTLQPNTKYWLQVTSAGDRVGFQQTESDGQDARSQADWSIGNTQVKRVGAAAWSLDTTSRVLKIHLLGHASVEIQQAVSEPSGVDLAADNTTNGRLTVDGMVTGQHHAGILNVNPPIFDVDWFAFTARVNTDYQFTANPGKKGLPYYTLRILNDQGVEQINSLIVKKDGAYHSPDRRNILPFRTQKTGTYYVSIEAWRGNGSAVAYTLAMSGDDYSDNTATTATVTVDGSGRNFENFQNYLMRTSDDPEDSETSDVDWIHVSLKENTTYKIIYDVACLHEGIIVGIYNAIGNLIPNTKAFFKSDEKVRWCGDITTRFTPASDGDHYIAVTAKGANHPKSGVPNSDWNSFTGVQGTLSITVTSPLSTAATDESLRGVSQRVTSTPTRGAGDTYGVGDAITFELTFSEPVSVSGAPKLRFNIGGTLYFPEYATYVSVSGATLTFSYTVLTADIDTDGIHLFDDPLAYNLQNNDSIVSVRRIRDEFGHGRPLNAMNFFSGWDRTFPGHKVDGSLTN